MPASAYLDPHVLGAIDRLELRARAAVEGYISGRHRSPFHGFSVEFADYRGYAPGDDLRHLDWRTYARAGRYYVKQYTLETNLIAYVLLDVSESMDYGSPEAARGLSKMEYAKFLAASLAFLVNRQSDAVGLGLFDAGVREFVRHSSKRAHVRQICRILEQTRPAGGSGLRASLHGLGERIHDRGLIVIVSDLFDEVDAVRDGLQRLRMRGHEVIACHLLDPYEVTLPFDGAVRFVCLENGPRLRCHPRHMRRIYLEEVQKHTNRVRRAALACGADYCRIETGAPVDAALTAYLVGRERMLRGSRAAAGYGKAT